MAIKYTVLDFKDVNYFEKFQLTDKTRSYKYIKLPPYYDLRENGENTGKLLFNACAMQNISEEYANNWLYKAFDDDTECIVYGER